MTTSVLRPNATIVAADTLVGAATTHAAINDDSDASYFSSNSGVYCESGTVTLAAGSVTKQIRIRMRVGTEGGLAGYAEAAVTNDLGAVYANVALPITSSMAITTMTGAYVPVTLTQAQIDALRFYISMAEAGVSYGYAYEAYIDLVHVTVPTCNLTYPTGTPAITTTNRPIFTWTYTQGSDGGPQTFYETKVYTAAQYGAGGFDPATSVPFWTSGVTVGAATSQLSGVLTNSTTYRVYLRTAQTVNGVAHWSAFDFEGFSIAITTADISAIITTSGDTLGRILVAVDRSGSAWDFVEVQRSIDGGTTWSYVRGGLYVNPVTTTLFSTGDANNFDIYDYELGNQIVAIYRARATRIVTGLVLTGAWVQSTPAISWSSALVWLKDPTTPALNKTVKFREAIQPSYPKRRGVFPPLGGTLAVVVSDVLGGATGTLLIQTVDDAEMQALFRLLRRPVLLLQTPLSWQNGSRYIAPGNVQQIAVDPRLAANTMRRFQIEYDEVAVPADSLAGSP